MRSRVLILAYLVGLAHLLPSGGAALAQSNALQYMSPFAGIAIPSKEMKPGTKVIGGEPVGAPKLSQTLDADGLATLPNATGNVDAACANIAGQWDVTETMTITCVLQGFPPETITQSLSGSITMQQSGCNISYTIPQINFLRSGTINGNSIHMTGKFAENPQCVITQNLFTIDGTVENDRRISASGTGVAVGTCQGVPTRCDGTSTGLFTRDLPDLIVTAAAVSNPAPRTNQSFTVSATVRNQGNASAGATTLRYFRSLDSTITTDDTQIATDAVASLSPNGTSPESAPVSIDTAGTFWLGACVDPVSGDSPTTNNCSSGVRVEVTTLGIEWLVPILDLILN